jgi:GMP synthase-like glutamine amidotransferase
MRTLAIVHQRDAGPGVFADAARARGELDVWHVAERATPPADPGGYDAVLVFGGAMHVDQEDRHPWLVAEKVLLRGLLDASRPVLGVCLGAQLLSEAAGGWASRASAPEIGWFEIEVTGPGSRDPLIGPLAPRFQAFEWHSYECGVPDHAVVLARTPVCAQAYRVGSLGWGIQFHAEVSPGDADAWIADYRSDPDAVRIGIDPARLAAETGRRIEAQNALGRELCGRFLELAARLTHPGPPPRDRSRIARP